MKVEFLKNHLGNKSGDVVDMPESLANYLQRANVVSPASGGKETKVVEPVAEHSEPIEITDPVEVVESVIEAPVKEAKVKKEKSVKVSKEKTAKRK